ncbi:MAG: hypothetical protein A2V62_04295 [Nitrospirae bacterium RBG_19FT_COMBO_58_9]|nr:MAG: hypothetical protein A2V62_04295 [Nitrospirae bacterium RBG_19FT_COMBO_58_9]
MSLKPSDIMAMFTVYCDDSGTDENTRVAVVAGYLSNVAQWEIFNKEWTNVLEKFGVNGMRRTDLENFRGDFEKWCPARRTALLQQLQPIINRRTKMAVGTMVIKEDFEKLIPVGIREKTGGVYGFLAYTCLVGISQWCNRPSRRHSQPINWVFEAGTTGHGQVDKMFRATYANEKLRHATHLGGWSFRGKETVPLQSADLMAYECFKLIENQVVDEGKKRPVRISMTKLVGAEKYPYLRFFDKPGLEKFVTEWESRVNAEKL